MTVHVITSSEDLHDIATEWADLWRRDPGATPFQSPHWLLPWWEQFGSGELATIATSEAGRLESLAPLYIVRDEDESLGLFIGTGISDYLDVLGTAPVMQQLASFDCQMWDLQQLRPSSPLLNERLPDSWSENIEDQEPCPVMTIGESIGSSSFQKKLRYYRRRLGNITFESATAGSIDELLDALFELHAARWKQRGLPGVLADDVIQRFHRDVARRMLGAEALRMYALRIDSRIAAIFYGFAHHDTVYYYLGGYDPAQEKMSIGTVIIAHAVEAAARAGAKKFDFLRGAEEYKYAWGATDRMNRRRQLIRGS